MLMIAQLVEVHSAVCLAWRRPPQPGTSCVVPRDDDVTRGAWSCNDDMPRNVFFIMRAPYMRALLCIRVVRLSVCVSAFRLVIQHAILSKKHDLRSHVEVNRSKIKVRSGGQHILPSDITMLMERHIKFKFGVKVP